MVKDETAAEELVQEIFTRIWQKHAEIHITSSFAGYLYQSGRNSVYNFFEKLGRDQDLYNRIKTIATEEYSHVEEALLARENAELLEKALATLSPQRKKAFELCKLQGLSYQEAADQMGISVNTLKDHMVKAKQAIREFLAGNRELAVALFLFMLAEGMI